MVSRMTSSCERKTGVPYLVRDDNGHFLRMSDITEGTVEPRHRKKEIVHDFFARMTPGGEERTRPSSSMRCVHGTYGTVDDIAEPVMHGHHTIKVNYVHCSW